MQLKIILPILITLFLQLTNTFAQGKWVMLESPTKLRLNQLFCTDSLTCWAAGDSGVVINTTNGGTTWETQNLDVTEAIQSIFFLNNNLGWAISIKFSNPYGTYIHKTTNGGTLWEKEYFPIENIFLHTVYFLDSLNGWVGGSPTAFFGTTDGGMVWKTPRFDSSLYSFFPVTSFNFYSPQFGFATGGGHDIVGVIWRTKDYGISWLAVPLGPEPLQEIHFIDSLKIVGVGGDYEFGTGIARSEDGGENWTYTEPGFFGVATGVSFRTDAEAWGCLGPQKKFIFSNDSGKTWIQRETVDSTTVFDIVFTDSLHGFAVGENSDYSIGANHKGIILKYVPDIGSSVSDDNSYILSDYYLHQNYPNPFNPRTKISWQSSVGSWQSLKVYDILGTEVATLVDEFRPSGNFVVEFDSNINHKVLSSGIYFYQLKAGSFIQTKKMILLR